MTQREYIANLSYKYEGDWARIAEALRSFEKVEDYHIEEKYVTILDEDYPKAFLSLRYPPWVIFYEGDYSLLNKKCITIIGAREASQYALDMCELIVNTVKDKYVYVSGLAKGIDGRVHDVALKKYHTIGVIGSGLKTSYPSCNTHLYKEMRKKHLIISEYPYNVGIRKHHFPWRNRLLAALSEKLIVVEAKMKSGTMLTVNEALALGKEVYCVPHRFNDISGKGSNKLINDGAFMLYTIEQIKEL